MVVFPIRRLRQREEVLNEKQTMLRKDCAVDSTTMNDKEEKLLEPSKKATVTTTMNTNSRDSFFTYKKNQEDQLNSTKHQIDEAKEENERLKFILSKITRDYQSLQIHFQGIVQHEKLHKSKNISRTIEEEDEVELVSLSLGRNVGDIKQLRDQKEYENECKDKKHSGKFDGLELGLECRSFSPDHFSEDMKIYSPENSFEESKKEDTIEPCIIQNPSSKMVWGDDEDFQQQNPLKKARVSIRAVCDTTTMNDGCQWRKYGQKIAKGNPCPRAYYRCTVSPSCPVRKQVQRCFEDMSILTTTYEGTHNHPLPVSATAMASTTSAAASMLRCTSSSSTSQHNDNYSYFSFNTSNNTTTNNLATRPPTFHLPKTSISTSQSHPTITLDFTNHVPSSSSSSNTHRLFSSSSLFSSHRYNSSTSLNFSSSAPTSSSNSYTSLCNNFKSQMGADSYLGRPCFSQPFISKNTHNMTVAEDNVTPGI